MESMNGMNQNYDDVIVSLINADDATKAREYGKLAIRSLAKAYLNTSDLVKVENMIGHPSGLEETRMNWSRDLINGWRVYHNFFTEEEKQEIYNYLNGYIIVYKLKDIGQGKS